MAAAYDSYIEGRGLFRKCVVLDPGCYFSQTAHARESSGAIAITYAPRNTPERADDCLPSSNEEDLWPREELRLPRDGQEEQLEVVEYGEVR